MSDSEEIVDLPEDGDSGAEDLFGDAIIQDEISERDLSEHESDRDHDGTRAVDYGDDDQEPAAFREKTVMTVPMYRHRIPRSDNGTVSLISRCATANAQAKADKDIAAIPPSPELHQAKPDRVQEERMGAD